MWALLVILMTQTGLTSNTTYFASKQSCETQATFMMTDMKVQDWIVHAYIHCMQVGDR